MDCNVQERRELVARLATMQLFRLDRAVSTIRTLVVPTFLFILTRLKLGLTRVLVVAPLL